MNDDYQLVEQCKHNTASAFEALYLKYAPRMKGVAYRYCNDLSLSEDILQEAFIKAFSKIKEFQLTGEFEAWLRRIVVNTAINYFNSTKKEIEKRNQFATSYENETSSESSIDTDIDDDDYSIEELMKAVNNLPQGYKMVFNLYAIDNYSHKEIADALGITEGTSKSQLSKARIYLRKELQDIKQLQHEQR